MKNFTNTKAHKINLIIIWILSTLLALATFAFSDTESTYWVAFGTCMGLAITETLIYFLVKNHFAKALLMVVLFGASIIVYSISVGGSDKAYIIVFFALGMVSIYGNSAISLAFNCIFIPLSVIFTFINPAYIDGPDYSMSTVVTKLIMFGGLALVLHFSVLYSEKIIKTNLEASGKIKENAEKESEKNSNIYTSIKNSNSNLGKLSEKMNTLEKNGNDMQGNIDNILDHTHALEGSIMQSEHNIQENFNSMNELKSNYDLVEKNVEKSKTAIVGVSKDMNHITEKINSAKASSDNLIAHMKNIQAYLKEIDNIASQTNLLSLNASVEAARSGIHGKGFAVVAGEINTLATKSAQTSKNISSVIEELVEITKDVSVKVTEGDKTVNEERAKVEVLSAYLNDIENSSKEVGSIVDRGHRTTTDLHKDFENMKYNITDISSSTQNSAAMFQEVIASISESNQSVANLSKELNKIESQL